MDVFAGESVKMDVAKPRLNSTGIMMQISVSNVEEGRIWSVQPYSCKKGEGTEKRGQRMEDSQIATQKIWLPMSAKFVRQCKTKCKLSLLY